MVLGLLGGKFFGVFGFSILGLKMGWYKLPENFDIGMLAGVSLLAGIGFTMSLFINNLAFENPLYLEQAKIGVLISSLIAGFLGYFTIKKRIAKKID